MINFITLIGMQHVVETLSLCNFNSWLVVFDIHITYFFFHCLFFHRNSLFSDAHCLTLLWASHGGIGGFLCSFHRGAVKSLWLILVKPWEVVMEWLVSALERDLGVDQRQIGPGTRPHELVALVSTRWIVGLRERRVTCCPRYDCSSDGDIRTLLQRSVKLPPGWTRVCIQGLRKSKLGYSIAREPGWHEEGFSQDSFMRQMQKVSECNIR